MDFFLLLLLTAVMLIRPEELFPELTGARLYLWTIILTTFVSFSRLLRILTITEISRRSILFCVLVIFASTFMSANLSGPIAVVGMEYFDEFAKVILYYLLLVAILDTPERIRLFLGWLIPMICTVAAVAALHYYEIVDFPLLPDPVSDSYVNPETGLPMEIRRALASGIFADPNDLCLIIVLGMLCCLYHAMTTPAASARIFWLLPIAPLFFVLSLTGSRGGMLGCLAGFGTIIYARIGLRVGLPMAIAGSLALLAFAGGRSADIAGGGTARERLNLWGNGLGNLFNSPFRMPFGLGPGWYVESEGLLAHNSYINAYVELGIIGGGAFCIAFLTAVLLADRFGRSIPAESWVIGMRPFMLAIIVAFCAGCFSLSRQFVLPTYLVLGLATAYADAAGDPPTEFTINGAWFRRAIPAAVLGLIVLKYLTQLLGQFI